MTRRPSPGIHWLVTHRESITQLLATMMRGGSPLAVHLRLTIAKVQATLASAGATTVEAIEEALARLDDPAFATMSALTMAVWGRRAA